MSDNKKTRLHLLDALRGFLMINMIAYHGMWNLVYLFGVEARWYAGTPKYLWQQFICWTFILLSGFCWSMSRSHIRRGLLVFGGGVLVSAVTCILMPENRIIFGILTCIGSCVLLMAPLEKLLKKDSGRNRRSRQFRSVFVASELSQRHFGIRKIVLCDLPQWLYRNNLTAYLGFPHATFYSTDYFSLIPWLFLFITGFYLYHITSAKGWNEKLFARGQFPLLNTIGRNSLLVYLLHQPVLYGLGILIFEYLV